MGAFERILAGVELSGGNLDRHAVERRTELAHQADAPVLRQRDDCHGAGMAHHVADGVAPVGQGHPETVDVEDAAGPDDILRSGRLGERRVAGVLVPEHQPALDRRPRLMVVKAAVAVVGEGLGRLAKAVDGGLELVMHGHGLDGVGLVRIRLALVGQRWSLPLVPTCPRGSWSP